MSPFCGVLNLNKPAGMTSRDVVNIVQRLVRPAKAGHAGTLDPLATGVLVVCVGPATRLIEYVQRMPKRYLGTFLLGRQSPTEDIEGAVVELSGAPVPTVAEIAAAASRLVGCIEQRPPAFSACKVGGRPAYQLARQGRPAELAARPVEIHRIEIKAYQYPELVLEVDCGSGTYIRALGRDLACSLGTAAVMSALTRTSIGRFQISESLDPGQLDRDTWLSHLQPPLAAVESLPQVRLSEDQAARLRNGVPIAMNCGADAVPTGAEIVEVAALDQEGRLVAILASRDACQWRVQRYLWT